MENHICGFPYIIKVVFLIVKYFLKRFRSGVLRCESAFKKEPPEFLYSAPLSLLSSANISSSSTNPYQVFNLSIKSSKPILWVAENT